jgi:Mg2+/Co2+ transporter CorB
MIDMHLLWLFAALLVLLLLSAFFSGSETALMTVNRYRLRHRAEHGHRGAQRVLALLERPERLIGLILLGNNFVNILASSIATVIALELGGEGVIALAAGILTLVFLVFAEVGPKTLGAMHPERIAYPAAYVYLPLLKVLYPVVWAVNLVVTGLLKLLRIEPPGGDAQALSREELRTVVSEAGAMIPERSRKMLLGILDLERATVEDIMIPRHEVEGIDILAAEDEIVAAIQNAQYTRLPLFDGSIDNVIGIFHARNALRAVLAHDGRLDRDLLREISRAPYFIQEGTPLYQQLLNFQRERRRVALVVDEYGDFMGLVTLVDLLEEIVGEFTTDPSDQIPEIHRADDGSLLIDCGISARDLNRVLHWQLPTHGPKTLNGLILDYMETIPEPGTSLKLHGHALEITQTAENAVKTVRYVPRVARRPARPRPLPPEPET